MKIHQRDPKKRFGLLLLGNAVEKAWPQWSILAGASVDAAASPWWLETRWLGHRNTVEAVYPLLFHLQDTRGAAFMTLGHVLEVLDTKDPEALVGSWLLGAPCPTDHQGDLGVSACQHDSVLGAKATRHAIGPCVRSTQSSAKRTPRQAPVGRSGLGSELVVEKIAPRRLLKNRPWRCARTPAPVCRYSPKGVERCPGQTWSNRDSRSCWIGQRN